MLALHSVSPGIGQIHALIPLFAIITVIFWRAAIKILFMIITIIFIILIAFGAVGLLEGMQHIIR
jgi:hypothetical protein